MLTGDKFETAENIGLACRLITPEFEVYRMHKVEDVESAIT